MGSATAMSAYVVSEVEILDAAKAERYRELAWASIARYGGRYLVRAAMPEATEGNWPSSQRLVIVEFPDMGRIQRWYSSPEYGEALGIRDTALRRRLLFVNGVDARLMGAGTRPNMREGSDLDRLRRQ